MTYGRYLRLHVPTYNIMYVHTSSAIADFLALTRIGCASLMSFSQRAHPLVIGDPCYISFFSFVLSCQPLEEQEEGVLYSRRSGRSESIDPSRRFLFQRLSARACIANRSMSPSAPLIGLAPPPLWRITGRPVTLPTPAHTQQLVSSWGGPC